MQNAEKREKCYSARDEFFACVTKRGTQSCTDALALYSTECPASWKNFFDRQRERQMVLEGQADVARSRRDHHVPPPQQQ